MAAVLQALFRHNHQLHEYTTLTADGKQETQVQFSRYLQDIKQHISTTCKRTYKHKPPTCDYM